MYFYKSFPDGDLLQRILGILQGTPSWKDNGQEGREKRLVQIFKRQKSLEERNGNNQKSNYQIRGREAIKIFVCGLCYDEHRTQHELRRHSCPYKQYLIRCLEANEVPMVPYF